MPLVRVARTYLELRSRAALRPAGPADSNARVVQAPPESVDLFRALYRDVGGPYHWRDRNLLPDDALRARLAAPNVQLWVLYQDRDPAGFFELEHHADGSVEIVYFGLDARFHGRGLGKHMLTAAAQAAWDFGAERVWLHTCTLDSPAALPNYIARGFEPFKVETYDTVVDDAPSAA